MLTKKRGNYGSIIVGLYLFTFEINAMAGIFGTNTLFSDVEGVVTINGKPCVAAKIEEKVYNSNGDEITATTQTDERGHFRFMEVSENKGLLSFLPGEFVATQRLVIYHEGIEYLGWANTKRSPEPNSESDGKPLSMICDLDKKPEEDDKYTGICRLAD